MLAKKIVGTKFLLKVAPSIVIMLVPTVISTSLPSKLLASELSDRNHCRQAVFPSPGANYNGYYQCLKERGLNLDNKWWISEVKRHCDNSIYFSELPDNRSIQGNIRGILFDLIPKGKTAWQNCYTERGIDKPIGNPPEHVQQF